MTHQPHVTIVVPTYNRYPLLNRLLCYAQSEARLYFWRTNHGAEVDLLIEKHGKIAAAFEIKGSASVVGADLSGIRAFQEEHPKVPCSVVSLVPQPFRVNDVRVVPWVSYLKEVRSLF